MKKVILGAVTVIFLGSSLAIANSERGSRGIERLQSALGLNQAQSTQVESIMQQHRAQQEALRTQLDQNMQSVLTAEQYTQFKAMKQRRGGGKHQRGQGQRQNRSYQ